MRTTPDRIRHAIGFEVLGLITIVPFVGWLMKLELYHVGPLAVFFSFLATAWNYIYNVGFDKLLQKRQGNTLKTFMQRVWHAVGFEGGFLIMGLPIAAWWLDISLWNALVMDIAFVLFYLVYAFVYNWAYDRIFPLPAPPELQAG